MLVGRQNSKHKILRRVLRLGNLRQIKDLLLADGYGVIDWLAVQVNVPFGILGIIDFIKHLPDNVPVNLLLRVFVLLLIHWVTSLERILILSIQIVVHLCSQVLVLILNLVVSFLDHLMLLLWAKLILLRH